MHVREGGVDVRGSPQPGAARALYAVEEGATYRVTVDPVDGYDITIGGACAAAGKRCRQ